MAELELVRELAAADHHLAVVAIARPDGSVQCSVVSAGVLDDPVDATPGVAFVAGGGTAKLRLLRAAGTATLTFKSGFRWVAVGGPVRLLGPDDPLARDGSTGDLLVDVAATIRSVYRAAGGDHDDWDEFDRVMAQDRRCAVFVRAERTSSNP